MDFDAQLKGDPNYKNSTNDAVKKIISQLESIDGLIVDLRNNQGGAVHEALRFSGLFLDNSKLVELKSVSVPNQIMRSEKNLTLKKKPTMVLINNQTAGAAEWVAAALMDNKYALIAGEHSYGLGTVSSLKELSKGRLQLPIAKVFRMNGKPLKNGVEPDIKTTSLDESTEAFAEYIRETIQQ
jgi:carboxyl-terminal processing protease